MPLPSRSPAHTLPAPSRAHVLLPALLLLLLLQRVPPSLGSSAAVSVPFSPSCDVTSVEMNQQLQWKIMARYTASDLRIAYGGSGDDILTVPILYFPTPGNGRLTLGSNPCIASPGPCCLVRFAQLYTSVALYRALRDSGEVYSALEAACADAQPELSDLDVRPLVRELVRYANETGKASAGSYYVTSALAGLRGCYANTSATAAGQVNLAVYIQHPAMAGVLSSPLGNSSYSARLQQLQTFVGMMWVRTLPLLAVGTGGVEYDASQIRITLDVSAAVTETAAALSHETKCRMTPQGVCLVCNNTIDEKSSFYIFTLAGARTEQCEFRCREGWFYYAGEGASPVAQCIPCTTDRKCPPGQFASACLLDEDSSCAYCSNQTSCPETGGWTMDLCTGGAKVNGLCRRCADAPTGARFLPDPPGSPGQCAWECGYSYTRAYDQCVFSPETTSEAATGGQISVFLEIALRTEGSGVDPDTFKAALAEQVAGLSPDNVYVLGSSSTPLQRRRLLQQGGPGPQLTQVQSYFWLEAASVRSDVAQDIAVSVRGGAFQASLSALTGTVVTVDMGSSALARYESPAAMASIVQMATGEKLQGLRQAAAAPQSPLEGQCSSWWPGGSEEEEEYLQPGQPGGQAEWTVYSLAGLCLCCVVATLLPSCGAPDEHGGGGDARDCLLLLQAGALGRRRVDSDEAGSRQPLSRGASEPGGSRGRGITV